MNADGATTTDSPSETARRRRGSLTPRFGLRTLLVVAILFSLVFGWIGRNYVRIRQEEAAIETLKQAGAAISIKTERGDQQHPATLDWRLAAAQGNDLPSWPARILGIADPYPVHGVELFGDPDDPPQDKALAALAAFPELEWVGLSGPAFDDASLDAVSKSPKLSGLMLSRTKIADEGLARLSKARMLESLTIAERGDAGDLFAGVGSLRQLRSVQAFRGDLSSRDVAALSSLENLRELHLTQVTLDGDDVFEPLKDAVGITHFDLSLDMASRPIGEADMRAIARLPSAEILFLCELDPALLPPLASIDSLKLLLLLDTTNGDEGAIALSVERPDVLVEHIDQSGSTYFLNGKEIDADAATAIKRQISEP